MKMDTIIASLDYDLQIALEDLYDLWSWHPGMG